MKLTNLYLLPSLSPSSSFSQWRRAASSFVGDFLYQFLSIHHFRQLFGMKTKESNFSPILAFFCEDLRTRSSSTKEGAS
jgi:hypothetical protein